MNEEFETDMSRTASLRHEAVLEHATKSKILCTQKLRFCCDQKLCIRTGEIGFQPQVLDCEKVSDIYSEEGMEESVESDGISIYEEGFMKGYLSA